jgi:phage terminase large subunit GpA-like protein
MRQRHVPCPYCGALQVLEWSRVEWDKDETVSPHKHLVETARYRCAHCPEAWTDADRWAADRHPDACWIAQRPFEGRAGFQISQLYNPWKRLSELATEFLASRGNVEREKVFTNTVLGLPYRVTGEAQDPDRLYERRETYRIGEVPPRGLVLVAGIDVHPDRIEGEVVAYGRGLESWSIERVLIKGDPLARATWDQFDVQVRNESWEGADGYPHRLSRIAIDTGYASPAVSAYWRRVQDHRVMLVKGDRNRDRPLSPPKWIDLSYGGKVIKKGVQLQSVGVDWFKDELDGFLRLPMPDEGRPAPGYCHFPMYPREFFDQLTAEERVLESTTSGAGKYKWVKVRERNEALDCRVYARAAAMSLRLDMRRDAEWRAIEEQVGAQVVEDVQPWSPPPPPAEPERTAPAARPAAYSPPAMQSGQSVQFRGGRRMHTARF